MTRRGKVLGLTLVAVTMVSMTAGAADLVMINDIRANPVRYWNTTVTVVGLIQDESIVTGAVNVGELPYNQLYVRTNNLPPIGKTFRVTGTVINDPTRADLPILKETSRTTEGMASWLKIVLIAAIVLFVGLVIVLVLVLARPKPQGGKTGAGRTMRVSAQPDKTGTDKTQVYVSLGASLLVEKGPDKGREFPLTKFSSTIGRAGARKNEIELSDDTVSKEQATIHYDSAKKAFSIVNESSTNPTKVNGAEISGYAALENDAAVEMGKTLLRFRKA